MTDKIALTDLANLQNENTAVAAINNNNAVIQTAFDNTLSRDGSTPNEMLSPLDMNSQAILNLPLPISGQSPLRLQDYNTLLSGGTIQVSNSYGVEYVVDGGGAQIGTGLVGFVQVPFASLISQVDLIADQTGSVVLDIWKCAYSVYNPPTTPSVANTITGISIPTITSGVKYQDSSLSSWNVVINAGDILAFHVNSLTNITRLIICLSVTKV